MRLVVKSLINKEVLLHDLSISSITRPTSYYRAATTHGSRRCHAHIYCRSICDRGQNLDQRNIKLDP